jgi:hypothetical protein
MKKNTGEAVEQMGTAVRLARLEMERKHGKEIVECADACWHALMLNVTMNCMVHRLNPGAVIECLCEIAKALDLNAEELAREASGEMREGKS